MKRNTIIIGLAALVLTIAGAVSAQAQSSTRYRADIPFDFSANGAEMKTGNYTVGPLSSISSEGPLVIQSRDGKATRILAGSLHGQATRNGEAKLIFVKTGNSYALSEVLTPDYGAKMKKTKTNVRQIARVDSGSGSDIVIVSLQSVRNF